MARVIILLLSFFITNCNTTQSLFGTYINRDETVTLVNLLPDSTFVYEEYADLGKSLTAGKWKQKNSTIILQSDSSYFSGVTQIKEMKKAMNKIRFVFFDQDGNPWCCPHVTFDDSLGFDIDPSGVLTLDSLAFEHFEIFSMTIPPYVYHRKQHDSNYFEVKVKEAKSFHFFIIDTLKIGKNRLYSTNGKLVLYKQN